MCIRDRNISSALSDTGTLITTLIIVITAVSMVLIILILSMSIRSRKRETGILLAVGIAKPAVILQYVLETLLIAVVAFPLAYLSSKQVAGTLGTLFGKAAENVIVTPEHFMLVAIVGGILLVAAVLVDVYKRQEVYRAYMQGDRKMRYFENDLKTERFVLGKEGQVVQIIPSREDSLDRLVDENAQQFSDEQESVESVVLHKLEVDRLHTALSLLTPEAVSYTHLDVYKRQIVENAAAQSSSIHFAIQMPTALEIYPRYGSSERIR